MKKILFLLFTLALLLPAIPAMALDNNITVGPGNPSSQDGTKIVARGGKQNDTIVSELHGRYYEQTFRGNVCSGGAATTALSANTITLVAATTPIVGVWNPPNSGVNLVIMKASATTAVTAVSAVAPGGLVWATSIGNGIISTGNAALNRKSLANNGCQGKDMSFVALTGLTNNLVIKWGSSIGSLVAAQGATVTPLIAVGNDEYFDGSLIVPPGGVLALLNTVSTTTVSMASQILWEEVPAQ